MKSKPPPKRRPRPIHLPTTRSNADSVFAVRITPAERVIIGDAARKIGMPISTYVRNAALCEARQTKMPLR